MTSHAIHENEPSYLTSRKGIGSWLLTLDHKRIGIMYLISVLFFFLIGGFTALLIRTELLTPGSTIAAIDADIYNQLFTLHGAIMVFLVIIPGIPAALGNFVLPLQLGAKDVAFPRLNLCSYYIYLIGAAFAIYSIIAGSVDTGWTFYTPYSTKTDTSVVAMTTAIFILGFSSIFTGLNFIVTIHKLRAPGMTWFKMPLLMWALYATAIVQVMATPVIGITLLLLIIERTIGIGIFDPELGGDPVLFQHFFWFYSHPAVYIMILPGMGIISEIIPAFTHKKIFGYELIAYSSIAIAVIGFLVWGHHMFVSGQSELASVVFSFLTFFVAIPSGVKIFNWVATINKGSISLKTPMIYALSFLFLFSIGGITGVFLGALSVDVHLHDTYFVVAHFHYVMMGGTITAFMGGLYYWWPKMTGRMYNEFWGITGSITIFIGFNAAFLTQFILGSQGMPRRYYNYLDQFQPLHQFSTFGAYVIGIGFIIAAVNLLHSCRNGKKAPSNPWGAKTMEWTHAASPPIEHNFHGQPKAVHGPYDY